jgi:hypothetical protein
MLEVALIVGGQPELGRTSRLTRLNCGRLLYGLSSRVPKAIGSLSKISAIFRWWCGFCGACNPVSAQAHCGRISPEHTAAFHGIFGPAGIPLLRCSFLVSSSSLHSSCLIMIKHVDYPAPLLVSRFFYNCESAVRFLATQRADPRRMLCQLRRTVIRPGKRGMPVFAAGYFLYGCLVGGPCFLSVWHCR